MRKKTVEGGVIHNGIFYMSGCCNFADTVEQEIRMNFEELGEMMRKNGTDFQHVLSATVYLKDIHDRERCLNDIWQEYFPENPPARTCIETGIGRCRNEITFVVAVPE